MTSTVEVRRRFIDDLYRELFSRGISYFLPEWKLSEIGGAPNIPDNPAAKLEMNAGKNADLELCWLGVRYSLSCHGAVLTEHQTKLLKSIASVLAARYCFLFGEGGESMPLDLYRGLPEDRFISAFLDPSNYRNPSAMLSSTDRIADAIAVLRLTSSMTYENRRIATGALLFGASPDPCHPLPPVPPNAVRYGDALTVIRSFHRLSDGLQTVALVDTHGQLIELIDVQQWAKPFSELPLPAPSALHYAAHSRATLCGGHIFLILTPNGEIKIIANGTQIFNFIDGRWRLTDLEEKYRIWEEAVGDRRFSEMVFTVALNLADARRGCLFVILDDEASASQVLSPHDLLHSQPVAPLRGQQASKIHLHYLLRGKRLLDLPSTVVESVARIDGAIVLAPNSDLLAFGAILHPSPGSAESQRVTEGGRTTAALEASLLAKVLKVSEDGQIAFYRNGSCIWEM